MTSPFPTALAHGDLDADTAALDEVHAVDQSSRLLQAAPPQPTQLPPPSATRLSSSLTEEAFDIRSPTTFLPCHLKGQQTTDTHSTSSTVLYLSYGSNLCFQTFQGARGIRPLSAVNVVVPDLKLTFDLPGVPYTEPCFANSQLISSERVLQKRAAERPANYHDPVWSKGLVGVVYEVTLQDYANVIATEGGGSAYADILVPCYALPRDGGKDDGASQTVPEDPASADPPLPYFKAHTLHCPGKTVDGRRVWRRDRDYAQPSLRYLNLLRTGAEEHRIPQEYQDYLQALHPYAITTRRQEMGAWLFGRVWGPFLMRAISMTKRFADHRGRSPRWLRVLFNAIVTSMWTSYDSVFRPLFGDGERTIEDGGVHAIGAAVGKEEAKAGRSDVATRDDAGNMAEKRPESAFG